MPSPTPVVDQLNTLDAAYEQVRSPANVQARAVWGAYRRTADRMRAEACALPARSHAAQKLYRMALDVESEGAVLVGAAGREGKGV